MFHSALVSEPAAWLVGLLFGWAGSCCAQIAGAPPEACVAVGSLAAVVSSLCIGTPINAAMLDVLSLIVLRPLTGAGLWQAMELIARGMGT
jgi:hypothetical protein